MSDDTIETSDDVEDAGVDPAVGPAAADDVEPPAPIEPADEPLDVKDDDDDAEDEDDEVSVVNVWLVRALIVLAVGVLFLVGLVLWKVAAPARAPRSAAEQEIIRMRDEVKKSPNSPEAHVDYANALYRTGDVEGAIAELEIALKLNSAHPLALYNLAIIQYYNGEREKAIAGMRVLVKRSPTDPEVSYRLGVFLEETGDLKGAADAFGQSIQTRPEDVTARVRYGDVLAKLGKADEAKAQYEAALTYVPDYEPAKKGIEDLKGK